MRTPIAVLGVIGILVLSLVVLDQTMGVTPGFLRTAAYDPLPNSRQRPQLLTFGMYVTPDPSQNPIDPPERFTGYHAGLDLEIHEDEQDNEIPVHAVCSGEIASSGLVPGYGGLVVQRCKFNGDDATVMYGHLDVSTLPKTGSTLKAKQKLGILAQAHSEESGGNRKHLHLGIHQGTEIDVRGYVQTEEELTSFLDPKTVLGL